MSLPSWLEPSREIPLPARAKKDLQRFVREMDAALKLNGVPEWQRVELIAIAACETAWGTSSPRQVHNLGGQKAKRDVAEWHRRRFGFPMSWCRAPGHVRSGDSAVVIYAAFSSDENYWAMALARVFGTGIGSPWMPRYATTAKLLWAGDPAWIDALIAAEYRGSTTTKNPRASIASHRSIAERVRKLMP